MLPHQALVDVECHKGVLQRWGEGRTVRKPARPPDSGRTPTQGQQGGAPKVRHLLPPPAALRVLRPCRGVRSPGSPSTCGPVRKAPHQPRRGGHRKTSLGWPFLRCLQGQLLRGRWVLVRNRGMVGLGHFSVGLKPSPCQLLRKMSRGSQIGAGELVMSPPSFHRTPRRFDHTLRLIWLLEPGS